MSKEHFEKYTNAQLTELIRSAMREGCIKPCHVYDAVDILLDRLANKPLRNCDIGTAEEQGARFEAYCDNEVCNRKNCGCSCKALYVDGCALEWAQMLYQEGGKHE